jgi:hypothetical protein
MPELRILHSALSTLHLRQEVTVCDLRLVLEIRRDRAHQRRRESRRRIGVPRRMSDTYRMNSHESKRKHALRAAYAQGVVV